MISDKSFANNEVLTFYPKFFRRFFGLLPVASVLIGYGFFAEFMMTKGRDYYGNPKRGNGYIIAAFFAVLSVYFLILLMNERLTIDQTAVCIGPIFGKIDSFAKPPQRFEWEKIALIKQNGQVFRRYDFYTAAGEHYGSISYRGWHRSKKLQTLIIGRVLAHGGRFEVPPPRPRIPLAKRLSALWKKFLKALKAQFMPR